MVSTVLSDAVFHLDLRSGDLCKAIEELADELFDAEGVADLQVVVTDLLARGRRLRASGEHEVAIVHSFTPTVERLCVALGRSTAGIVLDGTGGPVIHFVCLLVVPSDERRAGFRFLNGLAVLFRDPMVRTQLLWAETPEEALAVCREAEGSRWVALASWLKDGLATAVRPSVAVGGAPSERA